MSLTVSGGLAVVALGSSAEAASLFDSNFDTLAGFNADWNIIDAALTPTEGAGSINLSVVGDTQQWGRTDSNTLLLGGSTWDEMMFSITMDAIQADWTLVNIAFFEQTVPASRGIVQPYTYLGAVELFGDGTTPLVADGTVMRTGVGVPVPVNADAYRIQIFVGGTGASANVDNFLITVPEPGTLASVGAGLFVIGALRRRSR